MLRLLVVEGNTREARERRALREGLTPAQSYGVVLSRLAGQVTIDIATPADIGTNLPSLEELSGYDGIAMTGSSLHLYEDMPEIRQQIDFARIALQAGTPIFGSCWGVQVLSAAAGGTVHKNPKGRELPIARKIISQPHPLFEGKPSVFDAPAVHLDEVVTLPQTATLLASNGMSTMQAFELKTATTTAWGVQYHPEYSLHDLAGIMSAIDVLMLQEGFVKNKEALSDFVQDYRALHANPQDKGLAWKLGLDETILNTTIREAELANWLKYLVKPIKSQRGRG